MRRANNKNGQWVELSLQGRKGKIPGLIAYLLPTAASSTKRAISFTKEGEFFRRDYITDEKVTPIDPPKWGVNMYIIPDRITHIDATLYDAKYKTIIGCLHEVKVRTDIAQLTKTLKFLNNLKNLEPWR